MELGKLEKEELEKEEEVEQKQEEKSETAFSMISKMCGFGNKESGKKDEIKEKEDTVTQLPVLANPDNCYFRPAMFWQYMRSWHIAEPRLEFRIDITTKKNQARWPCDITFHEGEMLEKAKARARKLVSKEQAREDGKAVNRFLSNAVSWNNIAEVEYLLRTCWVTEDIANPILIEAAMDGSLEVVSLLLEAGANPTTFVGNKNAWIGACQRGNEEIAKLLLNYMPSLDDNARKGFEILRDMDLCPVARRLEAFAEEKFKTKDEDISLKNNESKDT